MGHSDEMLRAEQDKLLFELALVQRIERGLATRKDAQYVARVLNERRKHEHLPAAK
jgi:hypothetical protein